jgi:SAM-dependent methyltransferase
MREEQIHFDNIASKYDELLPEHIRDFLLARKTDLSVRALKEYGVAKGKGIDLGCGTGWYVKKISEYGYDVTGLDNSATLAKEARKNNSGNTAKIVEGDIRNLDFPEGSFDFAYCINSLHHLGNDEELSEALSSIHRILKKDGILVVHELNTFFLFRLYLNYIFPLTNKIDKFGGENWIQSGFWPKQKVFELKEIYYYTFFPHIIPKFMFKFFCRINNFCEKIFFRKFGMHYMAVLKK